MAGLPQPSDIGQEGVIPLSLVKEMGNAVLNGYADMSLQIFRLLLAGIIRIFLAVTLEMLITLNVFKVVLVVIVYGVIVMHSLCISRQEVQDIASIKALHALMHTCCVVSNGFLRRIGNMPSVQE